MAKKGKNDFFWPSYVDLMTNLFAIMLVLFVVSFFLFSKRNGELKVRQKQYERIMQLQAQFKSLSDNELLRYDEAHRIFVVQAFEGKELFAPNDTTILPSYRDLVRRVGEKLDTMLTTVSDHFNYLMVIEGYSANMVINRDTHEMEWGPDRGFNYRLSYDRAKALYNYWRTSCSIDLRKHPNVEVLLCGSGLNGIHRDPRIEMNNKRFVVQIIPRVAKIQADDEPI